MLVLGTYTSYSYIALFPSSCIVHMRNYTVLLLISLLLHVRTYIDKSMQIVLERGSIDNPLTFNIGLLQPIFHTSVFT